MSKRHQSNRRKSYGRRQHELTERRQREVAPDALDAGLDDLGSNALSDRFAFLGPGASRLHFAMGD